MKISLKYYKYKYLSIPLSTIFSTTDIAILVLEIITTDQSELCVFSSPCILIHKKTNTKRQ